MIRFIAIAIAMAALILFTFFALFVIVFYLLMPIVAVIIGALATLF